MTFSINISFLFVKENRFLLNLSKKMCNLVDSLFTLFIVRISRTSQKPLKAYSFEYEIPAFTACSQLGTRKSDQTGYTCSNLFFIFTTQCFLCLFFPNNYYLDFKIHSQTWNSQYAFYNLEGRTNMTNMTNMMFYLIFRKEL